jgi:hypothetical protein
MRQGKEARVIVDENSGETAIGDGMIQIPNHRLDLAARSS